MTFRAQTPTPDNAPTPAPPTTPPLLGDARESARLLGISRTTFFSQLAAGRIGPRPIRIGRCLRFSREEIQRWCAAGCPPRNQWPGTQEREG